MDILAELESMAVNVDVEEDVSDVDIERMDFSRARIPDGHWDAVQEEMEGQGHNRESYEYSLTARRRQRPRVEERGSFILRLAGPLNTARKIQEAAALDKLPVIKDGVGESGDAQFCEVDGTTKDWLLDWVAANHTGFQPTFVRLNKAKKELCRDTQAPMLGRECTLPQHRLNELDAAPVHAPDQYPVWYFFYGTLADPEILTSHLGLDAAPEYIPARVNGGRIRTWAGKYKAMVDAPGEVVDGSAFLVQNATQEDALRLYETDKYEVVRCQITTQDGEVKAGLTFRFDGTDRDLD